MSVHRRMVRVTYDAVVSFHVSETGDAANDASIANEAASVVALSFIGQAQADAELPIGTPVKAWVYAASDDSEFEGDAEITRIDSSFEIRGTMQMANLDD